MNYTDAIAQLQAEDYAPFAGITIRHNGNQAATYADLIVMNDATGVTVKPTEQILIDAYARWQAADSVQQSEDDAKAITKNDILAYLRTQMFSASPDSLATLYTTVSGFADSNTKVQNAVTNTLDLFQVEDSVIIDTATNAGKARYIRACLAILPFAN